MNSSKLLLVEDDPRLVRALIDFLQGQGYCVDAVMDGERALETAAGAMFDLIILDVMLPDRSGLEVCLELRKININTPVIMLTARGMVADRIAGLKSGADDYLTKPFDMDELRLRIEALLRRTGRATKPAATVVFAGMQLNLATCELARDGRIVQLSERECRLLRYFIMNRGETISRDMLLQHVWGYTSVPFTRTVDVHIMRLRQKIEPDPRTPRLLITVPGLGYRFDA